MNEDVLKQLPAAGDGKSAAGWPVVCFPPSEITKCGATPTWKAC